MKVALVHDYLKEYGGAERVLEAMHEIWPQAPVYTAYADLDALGPHKKRFENWDIRTSFAQNLPFFKKYLSPARILAPKMFKSFDLSGFDVVISSSSVYFAKAVCVSPKTLHISYCHTPPRYLYGYITAQEWEKRWFTRVGGAILNHFLRIYDFETSQRVHFFVANSHEVARRIKKFYRREAEVIYPPVAIPLAAEVGQELGRSSLSVSSNSLRSNSDDTKDDFAPSLGSQSSKPYFLCVSRLVRAKRIDLAIEACQKLGLNLKIVGRGREEKVLKSKIQNPKSKNIEFLGEVSDEELAKLYQNCTGLIFCAQDEDFGIVPVETMAAGKPVIALASGGVLESVIPHKTGEFFTAPTVESLVSVLRHFDPKKYKPEDCRTQSEKFSKEKFKEKLKKFVEEKYEEAHFN